MAHLPKLTIVVVLGFFLSCQNPKLTSTASTFSGGIYYRLTNINDPTAILSRLDTPLTQKIVMPPVNFDIRTEHVIYADNDTLYLLTADGNKSSVQVAGLYQIARPVFSPHGKQVAVQARVTSHPELQIFVITLETGTAVQISTQSTVPNESPTWFKQSNKVVYSTFSSTQGVDVHVYDVDKSQEIFQIPGVGWHGLKVSKDDRLLFVPNSMTIYNLQTGAMVSNLLNIVSNGIISAGFQLQTNVGDSGSPFLDGDWSPDGKQLVFDVAVQKNGGHGVVIFTSNSDGSGVIAKTDFLNVNPSFSNNLNYSQTNPKWL